MTRARRHVLLLLLGLAVLQTTASAHQLDEYVQAMLVDLDPSAVRLHVNLTPGVEVAEQVLALIDGDRDGAISRQEADAYAGTLKRDLAARLDGRQLDLQVVTFRIPEPSELRSGWGILQIEFTTAPIGLTAGEHKLVIENRHSPSIGAYLFNAARPRSESINVVRQDRNENQSRGEIDFSYYPPVHPPNAGIAALLAAVGIGVAAAFLVGRRIRADAA